MKLIRQENVVWKYVKSTLVDHQKLREKPSVGTEWSTDLCRYSLKIFRLVVTIEKLISQSLLHEITICKMHVELMFWVDLG